MKRKLFMQKQNNSGGYYVGPHVVLVYAKDDKEAWDVLLNDDTLSFSYCECCGPRWDNGFNEVEDYSEAVLDAFDGFFFNIEEAHNLIKGLNFTKKENKNLLKVIANLQEFRPFNRIEREKVKRIWNNVLTNIDVLFAKYVPNNTSISLVRKLDYLEGKDDFITKHRKYLKDIGRMNEALKGKYAINISGVHYFEDEQYVDKNEYKSLISDFEYALRCFDEHVKAVINKEDKG